nr:MAG TPA: hypothetical protein [Caudoviricetes sp.]
MTDIELRTKLIAHGQELREMVDFTIESEDYTKARRYSNKLYEFYKVMEIIGATDVLEYFQQTE